MAASSKHFEKCAAGLKPGSTALRETIRITAFGGRGSLRKGTSLLVPQKAHPNSGFSRCAFFIEMGILPRG
jgi:hypothetical protein